MNTIRKSISSLFALSAALCVWNGGRIIFFILRRHDAFQTTRSWIAALLMPLLVAIYSIAVWTIWTDRTSARLWGVLASLTFIALPVWSMLYLSRPLPTALGVMLAIGIAGLVIFLKRQEARPMSRTSHGE